MSLATDPWTSVGNSIVQDLEENSSSPALQFEDNFATVGTVPSSNQQPQDGRLPDSDSYLAVLERRLKRLKTNPTVLQQLAERREACMQYLLNDSSASSAAFDYSLNLDLDEPVNNHELLRLIRPEQPLSVAEVVHLVKHDHLEQQPGTGEQDPVGKDGEESGTESSTSR